MKKKYRIILNYLFLAFIFIWQSLRMTIFNGVDGKGRLTMTLSLLILIINLLSSKSFLRSFYGRKSVLKFWLFWFFYAMLNTVFQFKGRGTPLFSFIGHALFIPLVVMSIIANFPDVKIKRFLKYFQYIIYISFLILFIFAKNKGGRLTVELFDPNELSLIISLLFVIISVRYIRKEIKLPILILLFILPIYYTLFSGSRMAFGSFILLIFGLIFSLENNINSVNIVKYIIFVFIFLIIVSLVVEQTVLAERLLDTANQTSESVIDNPSEGTIFEYYGDRGVYYVLGWYLFLENPLFGIGLKNFIDHWPQVLHVEYMIQLAELGIIGFLLYILFNSIILKRIIKKRRETNTKSIFTYFFFVIGSILFSASVLFLYPSIAIAALYGLLILFTKKNKINKLKICIK